MILYEYNENASDERVKGLMLKAQHRHPESQKLYLTFFQMELENRRKADEDLALQHATVVYAEGKKKFPTNFNYYLDMLKMVDKFEYAHSIQAMILNDMTETFRNDDLLWHTFAQRELVGLSTGNFRETIRNSGRDNGAVDHHMNGADDCFKMSLDMIKTEEQVPAYLRKRIEYSVQIYEESVKVVITFILNRCFCFRISVEKKHFHELHSSISD